MAELTINTPTSATATTALLLGSGELGKEVAIELQRLGVRVVAVDRYPDAPAMQVAHEAHVVNMLDPESLRAVIEKVRPDFVIPEVEAIATETLVDLEKTATWPLRVAPTAEATALTMDREGIRRLAAETLGIPTSAYQFVDSEVELRRAVQALGLPCVLKPVMSSSGKGQSVIRSAEDCESAWNNAQEGARGGTGAIQRCIVESFVDFDDEITLLTVRSRGQVRFLDPIHHLQVDGDYSESWQYPAGESALPASVVLAAQQVAATVTGALGGTGLFGVELFIKGDQVIFSEVSPRPHDTGLVTLVSQDLSEFALHARAVLDLPAPTPTRFPGGAASVPIKVAGTGIPAYSGLADALAVDESVQVRVFGKPSVDGERRVAVVLARGADATQARATAKRAAAMIGVDLI